MQSKFLTQKCLIWDFTWKLLTMKLKKFITASHAKHSSNRESNENFQAKWFQESFDSIEKSWRCLHRYSGELNAAAHLYESSAVKKLNLNGISARAFRLFCRLIWDAISAGVAFYLKNEIAKIRKFKSEWGKINELLSGDLRVDYLIWNFSILLHWWDVAGTFMRMRTYEYKMPHTDDLTKNDYFSTLCCSSRIFALLLNQKC